MGDWLYLLAKILVLPPALPLLLIGLGLAWCRRTRAGVWLAGAAAGLLWLLSLPLVASWLLAGLQPYPALTGADLARTDAAAILVLGGDRHTGGAEYGGDQVGALTLQRLRYAAWLQRRTGLPLYVSGGSPRQECPPLGELMRQVLEQEFGVPVAGLESRSRTTRENARFSARLLRSRGVDRVLLVSHAWHLPRAVAAFEAAGLTVVPAPTALRPGPGSGAGPGDWLPSAPALAASQYAVYEYLGRLWYRL
jgi:uncharacterized SAM-binding protein YcdF (DUF218 family)